jgi:hypothetical protein
MVSDRVPDSRVENDRSLRRTAIGLTHSLRSSSRVVFPLGAFVAGFGSGLKAIATVGGISSR